MRQQVIVDPHRQLGRAIAPLGKATLMVCRIEIGIESSYLGDHGPSPIPLLGDVCAIRRLEPGLNNVLARGAGVPAPARGSDRHVRDRLPSTPRCAPAGLMTGPSLHRWHCLRAVATTGPAVHRPAISAEIGHERCRDSRLDRYRTILASQGNRYVPLKTRVSTESLPPSSGEPP